MLNVFYWLMENLNTIATVIVIWFSISFIGALIWAAIKGGYHRRNAPSYVWGRIDCHHVSTVEELFPTENPRN